MTDTKEEKKEVVEQVIPLPLPPGEYSGVLVEIGGEMYIEGMVDGVPFRLRFPTPWNSIGKAE